MKVSEILRDIMIDNNLSQTQLANMLNVSQKAISNWLNGVDKPNTASLLTIYNNFGITPNELLDIEQRQIGNEIQNQSYTLEEQTLIETYRALSAGKKKALFDMLDITTEQIKRKYKNE